MTNAFNADRQEKDGGRAPILPLTSVRFLAAAYVVLLHCFLWQGRTYTTTWMGRFISNG